MILIEDVSTQLTQADTASYDLAINNVINYAHENEILVVISTDRLSLVQKCDQLLYMESSKRVVETGSGSQEYDRICELIFKDSIYESDMTTSFESMAYEELS